MNRDGKCYDQNRIKQKFCCPCKLSVTCPMEHPKFFNGKKSRGCTKYITIPNDLTFIFCSLLNTVAYFYQFIN